MPEHPRLYQNQHYKQASQTDPHPGIKLKDVECLNWWQIWHDSSFSDQTEP